MTTDITTLVMNGASKTIGKGTKKRNGKLVSAAGILMVSADLPKSPITGSHIVGATILLEGAHGGDADALRLLDHIATSGTSTATGTLPGPGGGTDSVRELLQKLLLVPDLDDSRKNAVLRALNDAISFGDDGVESELAGLRNRRIADAGTIADLQADIASKNAEIARLTAAAGAAAPTDDALAAAKAEGAQTVRDGIRPWQEKLIEALDTKQVAPAKKIHRFLSGLGFPAEAENVFLFTPENFDKLVDAGNKMDPLVNPTP